MLSASLEFIKQQAQFQGQARLELGQPEWDVDRRVSDREHNDVAADTDWPRACQTL
jgi:hypothetical protein